VADRAEEFADWLAGQGRASNTVAAYRRDAAAYLRWRDQAVRAGVTSANDALADYVVHLRGSRAESSAARAVVALRMFHRWSAAEPGSEAPPELAAVPRTSLPVGGRELDEATIATLVSAARGDAVERRREAVAFALLYFGGLKASEAITLDTTDITPDGGILTVDRDGPHERVLAAVPEVHQALERWLNGRGRARYRPVSDALLVNQRGARLTRQGLWLVAGGLAKRASVGQSLSPNSLRRACAAHLADRGLPPAAISAYLGHTQRQPPGLAVLGELGWGRSTLSL